MLPKSVDDAASAMAVVPVAVGRAAVAGVQVQAVRAAGLPMAVDAHRRASGPPQRRWSKPWSRR